MKVLIAVLALAVAGFGQAKPELSKEQHLALENAQLKLKLSYVALQSQQSDFQQKLTEFNQACEAAVKAKGLEAGTRCNPDTLEFIAPPKKEEPKK